MNLAEQKILITGGHGFLGAAIIKNLIEKRGVSRKNISAPTSKEVDLRIKKNVAKAVSGMEVIIHCAAFTGGVGFHKVNPGQVFFSNAIMGLHLIEQSRLAGIKKFVSIGSATQYPEHAPMPLKEDDLWNGKPEQSQMAYSIVKDMLLVHGQSYRKEYGFNAIHLFMSTMYGPGDNWDGTYVIPSLIRQILFAKTQAQPILTGWGTGNATRDFLYIDDAAEGVIRAAEAYEKAEPVNIGSGVETPMREMMRSLGDLLDYRGEIRWDETKPEGQLRKVLDISRAQKEFNYAPKTDFATGLRKTIEAYKSDRKTT